MLFPLVPKAFTPASLFGASDTGGIWDCTNASSLWQNSNGTTAVTTTGDPIGRITDLSGKGNHLTQATGAARPAYNSAGYATFDGTAQYIFSAMAWTADWTFLVAYQSDVTGTPGLKRLAGRDANNSLIDNNADVRWAASGTTTVESLGREGRTRPNVFAVRRVSDTEATTRWNGQQVDSFDPGQSSSPAFIAFGADGGFGTNKGAMRLYAAIFIDRALTDAEIIVAEQWLATKIRSTRFQACDIFGFLTQSNGYFSDATLDAGIDVGGTDIYEFAHSGEILLAVDPLDTFVGRSASRIGYVMAFARAYIAAGKLTPGNKLLLVHCGYGGTGFSSSAPNTWAVASGSLRERSIARLNAAMEAAPGSTIKGIMWSVGETDTTAGGSAVTDYEANVRDLIQDVRSEVRGAASAPFILTEMPPTFAAAQGVNGATVQAVLSNAASRFTNAVSVSSASLTVYDGLHFNAASMRTLGARVFTAYDTID